MIRVTRRTALGWIGAAVGGIVAAACGVSPASQPAKKTLGPGTKAKLTMFIFPLPALATMVKDFITEYTGKYPSVSIEIYQNTNLAGYPKMVAQRLISPDQPLVNLGFFNATVAAQGEIDGMWNKLDYSAMSNAKDILPQFKRATQRGIGVAADQVGLFYNTKELSSPPTSWSDLWDPKFKGKEIWFDQFWYPVYVAAKNNGGSLDNMDPGWKFWADHAKWIRAIVSSNTEVVNLFSNGTATLMDYFAGNAYQFKAQGAPVDYSPPKEGAFALPIYLTSVVGNDTTQNEVAQDIINELISAKWTTAYAAGSLVAPSNTKAVLPSSMATLPAFSKDTLSKLIVPDYAIVGKHVAEWRQKWNQNITANI